MVVFSSYKVKERATYLAETREWIGDATWKRLDRVPVGRVQYANPMPSGPASNRRLAALARSDPGSAGEGGLGPIAHQFGHMLMQGLDDPVLG